MQVDENEIAEIEKRGFTNYLKLEDVPGEVDLVICAVPRNVVPYILSDAIKKGVAGMSVFTAGFAETREEEGVKLQEAIVEMANKDGMPIVGPNCMGVYNRRLGVKFHSDVDQGDGGNVSILGQSGTHTINMTMLAQRAGIQVGRGISIGNAVVVNEADYLEYLRDDPETEAIGIYLEGLKDGRRFFQALKETTPRKPVVIWKGGQTEAGQRATRSHTASLATPAATWDALIKQTGAIPANSGDELIDVIQALVHSAPPRGRRLALMAMTGGHSVAISDAFGRVGLEVPELSQTSYDQLGEFFNIIGGSYRNPFDMANTIGPRRRRRQLQEDHAHPRGRPEHRRHGVRVPGQLLRALLEGRAGAVRRDDGHPRRVSHGDRPAARDGDAPRPQGGGRAPPPRRGDQPRLRRLRLLRRRRPRPLPRGALPRVAGCGVRVSLARVPAPEWPLERWAVVAAALSLVVVPALILAAEVLAGDFVAGDPPEGVSTGDRSAVALMTVAMAASILGWTLLAVRAWHARRVEHVMNRALNLPATRPSVRLAALLAVLTIPPAASAIALTALPISRGSACHGVESDLLSGADCVPFVLTNFAIVFIGVVPWAWFLWVTWRTGERIVRSIKNKRAFGTAGVPYASQSPEFYQCLRYWTLASLAAAAGVRDAKPQRCCLGLGMHELR